MAYEMVKPWSLTIEIISKAIIVFIHRRLVSVNYMSFSIKTTLKLFL